MRVDAVMPASAPDQVGNGEWTSGETWETADEPASACPSTHPYAYNAYSTTGSYCCETADGNGAGQAGMNAHPDRQSRSNTCNGNKWKKCENPPCADYGDGSEFGRYITLKWTVPPNNGDELINHLVARDDGLAGAVDYLVCCPNAKQGGSQGCIGDDCCVDSVGVKSVEVVSGAGVCEEDALIRVVIGCTSKESQDAPAIRQGQACPAAEWLEPQTEYKWKVLARNGQNKNCRDEQNCNGATRTLGRFSDELTVTQPRATPAVPTDVAVVSATKTELALSWNMPAIHGSALLPTTGYRIICVDAETNNFYKMSTNKLSWVQPDHEELFAPGASVSPGELDTHTMQGLTAGTKYLCTLSAQNTIGGLNEPDYYISFAEQNTDPDHPDRIVDADAGNDVCGEVDTQRRRHQLPQRRHPVQVPARRCVHRSQ